MSAETKANVDAAAARVGQAQAELEAAKKAHADAKKTHADAKKTHAEAFRTVLVALCNEHGFTIVSETYSPIIEPTTSRTTEDDFSFSY